MDNAEILGHIGSALSSITFMPQVYQTWKTKRVKDLNFFMMLIVFISTVIWIIYGVAKNILPVIICNSIICALSAILIYFKIAYRGK